MGKAVGYTCDICKAFDTGQGPGGDIHPAGWLKVSYQRKVEEGAAANAGNHNALDVCSNECMLKLACERLEIPVPGKKAKAAAVAGERKIAPRVPRPDSDDPEAVKEHNRRSYAHRQHFGKGEVVPGCAWCDALTAGA